MAYHREKHYDGDEADERGRGQDRLAMCDDDASDAFHGNIVEAPPNSPGSSHDGAYDEIDGRPIIKVSWRRKLVGSERVVWNRRDRTPTSVAGDGS